MKGRVLTFKKNNKRHKIKHAETFADTCVSYLSVFWQNLMTFIQKMVQQP